MATERAREQPAAGRGTALVLGAGGLLGAAWMTGALASVAGRLPCPVGDVDLILGTSAGSVIAAALRCGVGVDEMVAYQRGEGAGALAGVGDVGGGPWPRPPRPVPGSPRLMLSALLAPHRVHPAVGASAWLPVGRQSHDGLREMVDLVHAIASPSGESRTGWVDRGRTWVVAVDYDSGQRVVFGREGAPRACLADAVVASCSIPGWYAPAVIGGRRYVDGGVRSPTSLGLLAGTGIGEAWVLAPMASVAADLPREPHLRLERRVRALVTNALLRQVKALRSAGVRVHLITPGPRDLAAMGINPMDPRRRAAVLETSLRTSPAAAMRAAA